MKDVTITKAALGRALDCSRSTITRLCEHGMPSRDDGRLDRTQALRWIREQTSGASGGWNEETRGKSDIQTRAAALLAGQPKPKAATHSRTRPAVPSSAHSDPSDDPLVQEFARISFQLGRSKMAYHLCSAVRELLLPILAATKFPGVTSEHGGFRLRLGLAALLDFLMTEWCSEVLVMGQEQGFIGELPPIDFKKLFPSAKEAKAWFEFLQTFWRSEPKEPEENAWPPDFTREWPEDGPIPTPPKAV
jgi:hypothetical protein